MLVTAPLLVLLLLASEMVTIAWARVSVWEAKTIGDFSEYHSHGKRYVSGTDNFLSSLHHLFGIGYDTCWCEYSPKESCD